ncbi:MAG: hypothetical protein JKY56_26535 [Kofleriaceae bacterium]|nr:hypothetical protein [Kofleriaceae bacterium]
MTTIHTLRKFSMVGLLGFVVAASACGKDKDDGDKVKGTSANKATATAGVELDCPAYSKKMTECLEPYADAFAKTDFGGRSAKGADGTVDHAKAAKNFKTVWGMTGAESCSSDYAKRDARWKTRFASCDNSASCDVWAPCMATATGELL